MQAIDISTGTPIDLTERRAGSTDTDRNLRLTGLVAGLVDRRIVLTRDTSGKTRLMAAGSAELGIPDVSVGRPIDTAVMPDQSAGFIASIVAPVVEVQRPNGRWFAGDVKSEMEVLPMAMEPDAQPPEVEPIFRAVDFGAVTYALAARIDERLKKAADFDLIEVAAIRLARAHALRWEILVANLLTASGSWPTASKAAATAKWNGGVSPNPITDIWARRAASSLPTDALVISESVEQYLYQCTAVQTFVQAGGKLPDVIVGRAKTATSGGSAYAWGSTTAANAVVIRRPKSKTDLSSARTFRWAGFSASPERVVDGFEVTLSYLQDHGTAGGWWLVAQCADDVQLLDSSVGGLITGVVA